MLPECFVCLFLYYPTQRFKLVHKKMNLVLHKTINYHNRYTGLASKFCWLQFYHVGYVCRLWTSPAISNCADVPRDHEAPVPDVGWGRSIHTSPPSGSLVSLRQPGGGGGGRGGKELEGKQESTAVAQRGGGVRERDRQWNDRTKRETRGTDDSNDWQLWGEEGGQRRTMEVKEGGVGRMWTLDAITPGKEASHPVE